MEIVLNSLLEKWDLVLQSMKDRLSSLDFNTLANEMLLKRERLYTIISIRRTGRSARQLDPATKFIPWLDMYELGRHVNDDVDDIIGYPDYVPAQ